MADRLEAAGDSCSKGGLMIGALQCIVLDCPDVMELATFYQAILGGRINKPDDRWDVDDFYSATLHVRAGLVLSFQHADDHRPPQWPDPVRPQQFHLDIGVSDLDRAERHVLELGAELLEGRRTQGWRVYADPAGHPFCLVLT